MRVKDPKGQGSLIHALFWALVLVVVGSLVGEWRGIINLLGAFWFWLGHQRWEYLELGRFWQVLLMRGCQPPHLRAARSPAAPHPD